MARVPLLFFLVALLCCSGVGAQMCPGVYEATGVNVTIYLPGYLTPYPSIKTRAINIGINATNTTTCYVYYDIYASIRQGEQGMLPRVTVGPIECDFGLTQKIGFATINNDSCLLNGTSSFCCSNICDAGIVALPTGIYPYTYYANFGLLRSITIGQNEDGTYWNGVDQAIELINVAWNEGTLSSNAVSAVASTTGVTTGTTSFATTAAIVTTSAASLSASVSSTTATGTAGAGVATVLTAAALTASATGLTTSVAATGSTLVSTTSAASTTATASTSVAATAVLSTAYATVTTSTVSASTTSVAAATTTAAAATTTAAAASASSGLIEHN